VQAVVARFTSIRRAGRMLSAVRHPAALQAKKGAVHTAMIRTQLDIVVGVRDIE